MARSWQGCGRTVAPPRETTCVAGVLQPREQRLLPSRAGAPGAAARGVRSSLAAARPRAAAGRGGAAATKAAHVSLRITS